MQQQLHCSKAEPYLAMTNIKHSLHTICEMEMYCLKDPKHKQTTDGITENSCIYRVCGPSSKHGEIVLKWRLECKSA